MTKSFIIIFVLLINTTLVAQNLGQFPSENNNDKALLTKTLLTSLNWNKLESYCETNEGHFISEYGGDEDYPLKTYSYTQVMYVADFEIIDYKGKVLEYKSQISNSPKETNVSYFDKNVWLEYAHDMLPNLNDSLKLNINEPKNILQAYYTLLGVDSRDEYGWICEYSTVGRLTDRRKAVLELIRENRTDLLKILMKNPNIEISLYAIDAMIYKNYQTEKIILNDISSELIEMTNKLEFLKHDNNAYERVKEDIGYLKKRLTKQREHSLTSENWELICELEEKNEEVKTCRDGTGSYKIYSNRTSEILSSTGISEIIEKYKEWQVLGYLD